MIVATWSHARQPPTRDTWLLMKLELCCGECKREECKRFTRFISVDERLPGLLTTGLPGKRGGCFLSLRCPPIL